MLVVYFYPTDLRVKRVDKCDWKSAGHSIKLNFTTFRTPR